MTAAGPRSGVASLEDAVGPGTRTDLTLEVDALPDGTRLDVPVRVLRGARPGRRVVVTAGVHGDEYEGPLAVGRIGRALDPAEMRGTLLLLPVVNRLAFRSLSRTTPADGLNLNREFPGRPDGSVTQRLAHVVIERVVRGADCLVDLHSGGIANRFLPIAGCRPDLPEVGEETCRSAAAFGGEFLWVMPPVPGVLSFEACRIGVPAVGVEIGGQASARAADVDGAVTALTRLLRYLEVLAGEPPIARDADLARLPPRYAGERSHAPATGLFVAVSELGQRVAAGEPLGHVWDLTGAMLGEVRAPRAGVVVALRTINPVHAGEFVALVLGPTARMPGGGARHATSA